VLDVEPSNHVQDAKPSHVQEPETLIDNDAHLPQDYSKPKKKSYSKSKVNALFKKDKKGPKPKEKSKDADESMSVSETNKLRESLGMKPLDA
jgi:hypothetical protein